MNEYLKKKDSQDFKSNQQDQITGLFNYSSSSTPTTTIKHSYYLQHIIDI
jgi:hypothetical protein